MKILFAAAKYDYCDPTLGLSNEYYFFYDTFRRMKNIQIVLFDWVKVKNKFGREKMNEMLLKKVKDEQPDLVFFSIFGEEFDKDVIKQISETSGVTTLNLFTNDVWQFDTYSKNWVKNFDWVLTEDVYSIPRYKKEIGYKNVLMLNLGINPRVWKKLKLNSKYDMSFVGQAYGNRKGIIRGIGRAGIDITAFGRGFTNGKVSFNEMIRIFNQTKINLNISEDSKKMEFVKFLPDFLQPHTIDLSYFQMKARVFEVPGCGGFLLTTYGEPLREYYKLGHEIETYKSFDELVEKAKFYLKNDSIREKIANAGYKKTQEKYTYEKIFKKTFSDIGLPV